MRVGRRVGGCKVGAQRGVEQACVSIAKFRALVEGLAVHCAASLKCMVASSDDSSSSTPPATMTINPTYLAQRTRSCQSPAVRTIGTCGPLTRLQR
jgi:hypothetical protein